MKKIIKPLKYICIFLVLVYVFSLLLYQTNFIHWGMQKFCVRSQIGCIIQDKIHVLMTPFNFYKVIYKNSIPKDKYIDIKLSSEELKYIQEKARYFVEVGFIEDSSNEWRKGSSLINGKFEGIKYKFQGTAPNALQDSRGIFCGIFKKLNLKNNCDFDMRYISLNIKHKKNSKNLDNIRRYNLKSALENDQDIAVIAMNSIAKNMGLLAPESEYKILRINGLDMGLFIFSEDFKKEWFEREHNITNYSIIKSIDDWNSREPGHPSSLDLTIEYQEIKTVGKYNDIALAQMELLFEAIKSENIEKIKKLIDVEDTAKYLALFSLNNNAHPLAGDNLKYIYNLSTGKFRFIFRSESHPKLMQGPLSSFNLDLFNSYHAGHNPPLTFKLFKVLLKDKDFRNKRDKYLLEIINNWENMVTSVIDKTLLNNKKIILKADDNSKSTLYEIENLKEVLNFHKKLASNYLEYNKVYITRRLENNNNYFTIYNDSFSSLYLKSMKIKNAEGIILNKKIHQYFPPLILDARLIPVKKQYRIAVDLKENEQVISFDFINDLTKKKVEKRHIYYNKSSKKFISDYTLSLDKKLFVTDKKSNTLIVKTGEYLIEKNIVTPYGYKVVFEPGVKLSLAPDVSILIRGPFVAEGTDNNKIIVKSSDPKKPFGTFSIYPENKNSSVTLTNFEINGGNEAIIDGVYFSGQISIHYANVIINNSSFMNSKSDDGINIKFSEVAIKNSKFKNNIGDGIDLDYCKGIFINNKLIFENYEGLNNIETDGLDISGTDIKIQENTFENFSDKGISVGEKSYPLISMNTFNNNKMALAIKDSSIAKVEKNIFNNNKEDITLYIKKKLYRAPKLILNKDNASLNIKNIKGEIIYQ